MCSSCATAEHEEIFAFKSEIREIFASKSEIREIFASRSEIRAPHRTCALGCEQPARMRSV
jgi:hypothetical protein